MKIRSGFVSNSSSSSFVLSGTCTNQVAKQMLDVVFQDWNDYCDTPAKKKENKARYRSLCKNLARAPVDAPITLPSTDYETYICRLPDGRTYVSTCNKHDWSVLNYAEDISYGADGGGELEKYADTLWYFDVNDCSMHSRGLHIYGEAYCDKCKNNTYPVFMTAELKLKCGICLGEDIKLIPRPVPTPAPVVVPMPSISYDRVKIDTFMGKLDEAVKALKDSLRR